MSTIAKVSFEASVKAGQRTLGQAFKVLETKSWKLGEIANACEPKYGADTIGRLAEKIDPSGQLSKGTLQNFRTAVRKYAAEERETGNKITVYSIFASQDDRMDLLRSKVWSVTEARELIQSRKDPQPATSPQPAGADQEPTAELSVDGQRSLLEAEVKRLAGALAEAEAALAKFNTRHPVTPAAPAPAMIADASREVLGECEVCGKRHYADSAVAQRHAEAAAAAKAAA